MDITQQLFAMGDAQYKNFQSKLMPTVNPDLVIGVRTPQLRRFALKLAGTREGQEFLARLPHTYYEENNLHAFILEQTKDFDEAIRLTEEFLPYIDNWATCDMYRSKVFKKNPRKMLGKIYEWIKSDKTYTVRYAVGLLMDLFLEEEFEDKYLRMVSEIKSDEYYINMMVSWYFATALAKQYDATLPYITDKKLDPWIHNKTIQKAVESYRISQDIKDMLKGYRIKK